jgi:hypothetical protein
MDNREEGIRRRPSVPSVTRPQNQQRVDSDERQQGQDRQERSPIHQREEHTRSPIRQREERTRTPIRQREERTRTPIRESSWYPERRRMTLDLRTSAHRPYSGDARRPYSSRDSFEREATYHRTEPYGRDNATGDIQSILPILFIY